MHARTHAHTHTHTHTHTPISISIISAHSTQAMDSLKDQTSLTSSDVVNVEFGAAGAWLVQVQTEIQLTVQLLTLDTKPQSS